MQWLQWLVGFVVGYFFALTAAQADLPDVIEKIKPSIVAIGTYKSTDSPPFTFRGTGFAFGSGQFIATNAHVLPDAASEPEAAKLVVLIAPNRQERTIRSAKVQAKDIDHDIAVLRINGPPIAPLQIGDATSVKEGQNIAFTGFPIGGALGFSPVTHRGIVAAITPITLPGGNAQQLNESRIRQLKRGSFEIFQLDATAYPGNSGSPVYHPATGRVIGIVNMVFVKKSRESALSQPSGITYAIPISHLLVEANLGINGSDAPNHPNPP